MLEDLILLRLLAASPVDRGEIRSKIGVDLRPLMPEGSHWTEIFPAAVNRLAEAGCIVTEGRAGARLRLTPAGQARLRETFGNMTGATDFDENGKRKRVAGWSWWRDRVALPKALHAESATDADGLRVALLRKLFLPDLHLRGNERNLGFVVDQLLAKTLKAPRANVADFRLAVLRGWLGEMDGVLAPAPNAAADSSPKSAAVALPEDLPTFAQAVVEVVRQSPSDRFGGRRMFIHHVWHRLQAGGATLTGGEEAFKTLLTKANNKGLLRLSRADLVGVHDPADLTAAETRYLDEVFHFIRLD
jgi:hypothetical protein